MQVLPNADISPEPEENPSFPPLAICIAGVLPIAFGVHSAIQTIANIMAGIRSFNIGFIGIIIGGGILIGRASSRIWALLFSGIGSLFTVIAATLLIAGPFPDKEPLAYPDATRTAVESSLLLICNLSVFILLLRKPQRDWFESPKAPRHAVKSLAWCTGILTAIFSILLITLDSWTTTTLARAYPVQVMVKPYDSVTGKGMQSISFGESSIRNTSGSAQALPKVGFTMTGGGAEGLAIRLSGVASQPLKIEVVASGYHSRTITIDSSSDKEVRVPLQPLHVTVEPEKS